MLTASEASSVYEVLTQYPSSDGPTGFGILVKHFWYDSCVMAEGEGGYHGGNDKSKIGVTGSHSSTAPSRTGVSSPSKRNSSSQFSSFVTNSVNSISKYVKSKTNIYIYCYINSINSD